MACGASGLRGDGNQQEAVPRIGGVLLEERLPLHRRGSGRRNALLEITDVPVIEVDVEGTGRNAPAFCHPDDEHAATVVGQSCDVLGQLFPVPGIAAVVLLFVVEVFGFDCLLASDQSGDVAVSNRLQAAAEECLQPTRAKNHGSTVSASGLDGCRLRMPTR